MPSTAQLDAWMQSLDAAREALLAARERRRSVGARVMYSETPSSVEPVGGTARPTSGPVTRTIEAQPAPEPASREAAIETAPAIEVGRALRKLLSAPIGEWF